MWHGPPLLNPDSTKTFDMSFIKYKRMIRLGVAGHGTTALMGLAWDIACLAIGACSKLNFPTPGERAQVGVACTCISLLTRLLKSHCEWAAGH